MLVVFCQPSRNIATITRALEHGWCVARIRTHETIDSNVDKNVDDHEAIILGHESRTKCHEKYHESCYRRSHLYALMPLFDRGAKSDAFRSPLNLAVVYHPIIILLFRPTHVHATIKRCPHAGISRLARTPFHTADVL